MQATTMMVGIMRVCAQRDPQKPRLVLQCLRARFWDARTQSPERRETWENERNGWLPAPRFLHCSSHHHVAQSRIHHLLDSCYLFCKPFVLRYVYDILFEITRARGRWRCIIYRRPRKVLLINAFAYRLAAWQPRRCVTALWGYTHQALRPRQLRFLRPPSPRE